MFDIKQLDNAYDPAEQIQIALGVHPDQADAQQTTADALAAAGINPSTSARAFDVGSNPKPADDTQTIAPIARPNGARAINMGGADQATTTDSGVKMIPPIASGDTPQSAISVNPMSSNDARLAGHKSELDRLQNSTDHDGNIPTGGASGIAQIQNPFLRGLARVGDIAGKVMFPTIEREIPGTEGHHQALVNEAQGNVASDLGEQSKELALTHQKLENDALDNKPAPTPKPIFDQAGDLIAFQNGDELLGPKSPKLTPDMRDMMDAAKGKKPAGGTPESQAMADLQTQTNPATGKAYTPYEAFQKINTDKAQGKPDSVDEQELSDFVKNPPHGYPGTPQGYAKWKATLAPQAQVVVSNAAAGGLKDDALDNAAEKYWSQGVLPAGGRGPAVMAQNQKIMNRAAELHSGQSIVEGSAAFKANQASLVSLQKNVDQVDGFERTAGKNLDVFLNQAKKVVDSGIPLINQPVRSVVGNMGGTDQIAFNTARTTALTEIAKVLSSSNASGVLSDSARHEVEGLIGKDATLAQIYSAAGILKQDMANRHQSYQDQIDDIKSRMPNKPKADSAAPKSAAKTDNKHADIGFVPDGK